MDNSPKDTYTRIAERAGLPLFQQPWWLDAVAGPANWDVAVVRHGAEVVAALPFVRRNRLGMVVLTMPQLTAHLGPWFAPTTGKPATRQAREKELTGQLLAQLPPYHHFRTILHPNIANWLPWYWSGFSQTVQYSYVLDDLSDPDRLWGAMDEKNRNEIRKARERHRLEVVDDAGLDDFMRLNAMTFSRQNLSLPYAIDLVSRIDAAARTRGCRRILLARDADGRAHAAVYIVWDARRAYYLMGGSDPELRQSGAVSLLLWHAILLARQTSAMFDFEGSMNEAIERLFRRFGARQEPRFLVWRNRGLRAGLWGGWQEFRRATEAAR